jgi:hypothetical protein
MVEVIGGSASPEPFARSTRAICPTGFPSKLEHADKQVKQSNLLGRMRTSKSVLDSYAVVGTVSATATVLVVALAGRATLLRAFPHDPQG